MDVVSGINDLPQILVQLVTGPAGLEKTPNI
jgi:hypothetical protein